MALSADPHKFTVKMMSHKGTVMLCTVLTVQLIYLVLSFNGTSLTRLSILFDILCK